MTSDGERDGQRLAAQLAAAELELERAHHLLDVWGLPRESEPDENGQRIELSLVGRLERLPEAEGDEDDEE